MIYTDSETLIAFCYLQQLLRLRHHWHVLGKGFLKFGSKTLLKPSFSAHTLDSYRVLHSVAKPFPISFSALPVTLHNVHIDSTWRTYDDLIVGMNAMRALRCLAWKSFAGRGARTMSAKVTKLLTKKSVFDSCCSISWFPAHQHVMLQMQMDAAR